MAQGRGFLENMLTTRGDVHNIIRSPMDGAV